MRSVIRCAGVTEPASRSTLSVAPLRIHPRSGFGEDLNEHITGEGPVPIDQRPDMPAEAIEIIRELHTEDLTTYDGGVLPGGLRPQPIYAAEPADKDG